MNYFDNLPSTGQAKELNLHELYHAKNSEKQKFKAFLDQKTHKLWIAWGLDGEKKLFYEKWAKQNYMIHVKQDYNPNQK